jgi:signal transduction histidine kinase
MSLIGRLVSALSSGSEGGAAHDTFLQILVDETPLAMLLLADEGTIVFTNRAARELFFAGADVRGQNLLPMLAGVSEPLRRALLSDTDHIFTAEPDPGDEGEGPETYHVAKRQLELGGAPHELITVRHMTAEISRQEIAVLKRTLRVIGHELANSLTPISSLLQTARQLAQRPEQIGKLDVVFATVEERLRHLHSFLGGFARLGQLPQPRCQEVRWEPFLENLRTLLPDVKLAAPLDQPGWFDAGQIQQVIINLVKNAREAGGPADGIAVELEATADGGARLTVFDRGRGMSEPVLASALVPSFTTKDGGSGMGLPLCREIVDAHGGRMRIARRAGGGTAVSIWLPPRHGATRTATLGRLTLTRS